MADYSNLPRSGSKVMDRVKADSGRASPANESSFSSADNKSLQLSTDCSIDHSDPTCDDCQVVPRLKSTATKLEILDAMCHPATGVGFLAQHPSLPSCTFVSANAVQWLILHVDGVASEDDAVPLMVAMLAERMICHASGDFKHPFIVGLYLYHVTKREKDGGEYLQPLGDLQSFENEWLEVEVHHPTKWRQWVASTPTYDEMLPDFLKDTLDDICREEIEEKVWSVPLYKHNHLEIDVNNKSDRVEWGHARYQSVFQPERAYELVVQWVTASGTIVSELILGWARKAQTCGLQMIPIPHDPLALPFTHKSDPLRGPIFIPMDTECLMGDKSYLFEEFPEDTWALRLFLFQEAIIQRFGFVRCTVENEGHPVDRSANINIHNIAHHHMFVHLSGNVFILIPSQPGLHLHPRSDSVSTRAGVPRQLASRRYPIHSESLNSPHKEYITRHVSGKNKDDYGTDRRVGFLWSWNHMVSRKWKSSTMPATGEEMFQKKIIKDFREFCANHSNRLKHFWDQSWALKEESIPFSRFN